jgi:hypothetical protein
MPYHFFCDLGDLRGPPMAHDKNERLHRGEREVDGGTRCGGNGFGVFRRMKGGYRLVHA